MEHDDDESCESSEDEYDGLTLRDLMKQRDEAPGLRLGDPREIEIRQEDTRCHKKRKRRSKSEMIESRSRVREIASMIFRQTAITAKDLKKKKLDIAIAGPWGAEISFLTPTWRELQRELKRLRDEDDERYKRLNELHDMGLINIYFDDLENIDLDQFKFK